MSASKARFTMRRLVSMLLLICFGMFIPAAGRPLHFCLLESKILLPGFQNCTNPAHSSLTGKCCGDCSRGEKHKEKAPCCLDAGSIPNGTAPTGPVKVPPPLFVAFELPEFFLLPASPVFDFTENIIGDSPEILRPDTPSERRAVLSIWRI